MKFITLIFLFLFIFLGKAFAQPGDIFANLNSIHTCVGCDIIIDSTTILKKIEQLKERKDLKLQISLDSFPLEFKNFVKTERLQVFFNSKNKLNDLSFLKNFPNLKRLTLRNYQGKDIAINISDLKKLTYLWIDNADNLKTIDAISSLTSLEKLYLKDCKAIKSFPKFDSSNQLKELWIEHFDSLHNIDAISNLVNLDILHFRKCNSIKYFPKLNEKNTLKELELNSLANTVNLENLSILNKLESLHLENIFSLKEIPNYFPKSLIQLEIIGNKSNKKRIEIDNINNLALYPNIEKIKLQAIQLKKIKGNFSNISLGKLELLAIFELEDISGLFTFKELKIVIIKHITSLKHIKPKKFDTNIEYFMLENIAKLENINKLLKCENIKTLKLKNVENIIVPDASKMSHFNLISIYNKDFSFRLENNN